METARPLTLPEVEVCAQGSGLDSLTENEIHHLVYAGANGKQEEFRRCALGIANSGSNIDSTQELLLLYPEFEIDIHRRRQGIAFTLRHAPSRAFREVQGGHVPLESFIAHVCAAARDLIYQSQNIGPLETTEQIKDGIYRILRQAKVFDVEARDTHGNHIDTNRAFCWGGHAINDEEYRYTKDVGAQLGLAEFEIISGGGPGAMRGPFSGLMRAKMQRRFERMKMIGLTCPSIITSEPPNEFVDPLVILPDIEKRLEAFVRASLGGIVFPGGVGTAEEIQTILGIMLHERNRNIHYPLIFTGPESSRSYFEAIDTFLKNTLGKSAIKNRYQIIIEDPEDVARTMKRQVQRARSMRDGLDDDYTWFKSLHIPEEVQKPFNPTHDRFSKLDLSTDQPPHLLAAQLRRFFSAIVHGNVSDEGIKLIEENGPYTVHGDPKVIRELDTLLQRFIAEKRMKISGEYTPCYELT